MMQAYRTENSYRSAARLSPAELRAAMASGEILQATALAFDTRRQLRFELGGVKAVMPFAQCADGAAAWRHSSMCPAPRHHPSARAGRCPRR